MEAVFISPGGLLLNTVCHGWVIVYDFWSRDLACIITLLGWLLIGVYGYSELGADQLWQLYPAVPLGHHCHVPGATNQLVHSTQGIAFRNEVNISHAHPNTVSLNTKPCIVYGATVHSCYWMAFQK